MKNLSLATVSALLVCLSQPKAQSLNYDFESGFQGWICDFADYPKADSVLWHLQYKVDTLPNIIPKQNGIIMKGDNFSDDLFFFLKRQLSGLAPNTAYTVIYSIDVVTNTGPDEIGGSDLMLKAGATVKEPRKEVASDGMYRMNIDKNNQSAPGPDMDTLGHINYSDPKAQNYQKVTFTNAKHPFKVKTDAQGLLWLIVGAESQFEIPAEFLVASMGVTLSGGPTGIARHTPAKGSHGGEGLHLGRDYTLTGRRLEINSIFPSP